MASSTKADVQSTQTCGPVRNASRASQAVVAESDVRLVYVAPLPIAGLERLHHGMSCLFEVFVGVLTGGGIAAADVSAGQTLAELDPSQSGIDTGLAALAAGLHGWIGLFQVLALRHEASSTRYLSWMKRRRTQIRAIRHDSRRSEPLLFHFT